MHTWVATCRVPADEVGQRFIRFEQLLESLTRIRVGLGCPIPDTIVLRKGCGCIYVADASSTIVVRHQIVSISKAIHHNFALGADDDENTIVACWMSERKDLKGYVWTCEYFTLEMLNTFVATCGPYMTGILQRYIPSKLHLGVNEVAQSLLGYMNFVEGQLIVERRYLPNCEVTNGRVHPTVRACLYPTVEVIGRVDFAKTLAFSAGGLHEVACERVEAQVPANFIGTVMTRLASALERTRADRYNCAACDVRPVGFMVAEFRYNLRDERVYLVNVLHVRHLGDTFCGSTGFELTKVVPTQKPMRLLGALGEGEFDLTDEQFDVCGSRLRSRDWDQHVHNLEIGPPGDVHGQHSPARVPIAPPDRFACPNCDLLCLRDELTAVPFHFMLDQFNACHAMEGALGANRSYPMDEGYWASLPVVLRRLNIDVLTLGKSRAWLGRSVSLCKECVVAMGYGQHEAGLLSNCRGDGAGWNHGESVRDRVVRAPPTCLGSNVIDGFVTTNLQEHHRALRRVERSKYMAKVANGSWDGCQRGMARVGRATPMARAAAAEALPDSRTDGSGGSAMDVQPRSAVAVRSRRSSGTLPLIAEVTEGQTSLGDRYEPADSGVVGGLGAIQGLEKGCESVSTIDDMVAKATQYLRALH